MPYYEVDGIQGGDGDPIVPDSWHRPHREGGTQGLRAVPPNVGPDDSSSPEGVSQQQQQAPAGPPSTPTNPLASFITTDASGNTLIFGIPALYAAGIGIAVYFLFFHKK